MKVDLFSFYQDGRRSISFMSQSLGLMADLDIGTEHLRWMGDTRFMVGLLRGSTYRRFCFDRPDSDRRIFTMTQSVIQFKACPVQLSYKAAESDKYKMAENVSLHRKNKKSERTSAVSSSITESDVVEALPPLKFQSNDNEGWTTFDEPLLYVYAGKGPFVGRYVLCIHVP